MLKWILAVVLVLAVLSVAGCCCCSSGWNNGYSYSTVGGQDEASAVGGQGATPYDSLNGPSGTLASQK